MSKELVIGKKYGRLTYLREIPEDKKPQQGHFLCDCGNTKILRLSRVKTGDVKSCAPERGCIQSQQKAWNDWNSRVPKLGFNDATMQQPQK